MELIPTNTGGVLLVEKKLISDDLKLTLQGIGCRFQSTPWHWWVIKFPAGWETYQQVCTATNGKLTFTFKKEGNNA